MGIDNAHIFNHNLTYTNTNELYEQLKKRTGKSVFNAIRDEDYEYLTQPPNDFNGFILNTENLMTADDYIQKKMLLEFDNRENGKYEGYFNLNSFVIDNSLEEAYQMRWPNTQDMCDLIREYGLRNPDEYFEIKGYVNLGISVLQCRQAMQAHIQQFGSTAQVTICSDFHDVYLDHMDENWTFEDFISWGKKEFIYVEFKDLPLFVFPEKKPDCFNVFIYDDFADLK